jgi:hypothetical protein
MKCIYTQRNELSDQTSPHHTESRMLCSLYYNHKSQWKGPQPANNPHNAASLHSLKARDHRVSPLKEPRNQSIELIFIPANILAQILCEILICVSNPKIVSLENEQGGREGGNERLK